MEHDESAEQSAVNIKRSKLNRGWVVKILAIGTVLGAIGLWGLYDAAIVYPSRGESHALFAEFQYLAAASDASELSRAGVLDPVATLKQLQQDERQLATQVGGLNEGSIAFKRVIVKQNRQTWLYALQLIGDLDEEHTTFDDARGRLSELSTQWQSGGTPKPLKAYDIPMQWAFCIFGIAGAMWILTTFVRTKAKVFTFDPDQRRLTLHGGATFTPSDIEELDKRRWHKFYVTVKLKEGASHQLDLLRYAGLEEWILAMEKHTDSYVPDQKELDSSDAPASTDCEKAPAETPG